MIGKVLKGKSFRGCLLYVMNDKVPKHEHEQVMKDRAEVIVFNECFGNARELIEQFNDVRKLNQNVSKPVLHISLSLSPGEKVSHEQLVDMSRDCAKAFGFEKNQYVSILHKDSKHEHIHIVANRIGFDGKTLSDSHNYRTMAELSRRLEHKHQLKQVLSPRLYLSHEERLLPRLDERKLEIKQCITEQLKLSKTLNDFEERMKEKGYQVNIGRGISFTDPKDVKVKGSELDYSLMTIQKILEEQEKQRQRLLLKSTSLTEEKSQQQKPGHDEKERKVHQEKIREEEKLKPHHRHKHDAFRVPDHSHAAKHYLKEHHQESMPHELTDEYKKRKKHRHRDHDHGMSI